MAKAKAETGANAHAAAPIKVLATAIAINKLQILVSGSTGLVGSALVPFLESSGHQVRRLARNCYDGLEGCDAVIHLSGRSIATRWTKQIKEEIISSRVDTTRHLAETLSKLPTPPKVLICASAVGFYGDRKDEILTEKSSAGKGFLAEVCKEWESALLPAKMRGIRCASTRFGTILSKNAKVITPFRFGLGAIFGSGEQVMSWIAIEDVIGAIEHVLSDDTLEGPINFTSPNPETNRNFSEKLAKALHRPLLFRIGERPVEWLLGEMGREVLLGSQRVMPEKLIHSGYQFIYPTLEQFLSRSFS
jgi:uncharacterized protein (TIGR01777 family)